MRLGGQTVTLQSFADGVTRDRFNQPEKVATPAVVNGVLMRTLSAQEDITLTDVATQVWRCTLPPVPAALNATASGVLLYDGTINPADVEESRYQITRVETFFNHRGGPDHVRITCQRQFL